MHSIKCNTEFMQKWCVITLGYVTKWANLDFMEEWNEVFFANFYIRLVKTTTIHMLQ
jgi:hypothetical protein